MPLLPWLCKRALSTLEITRIYLFVTTVGLTPCGRPRSRADDNMQWKSIDLGKLNFAPTTAYAPLPLFEAGLGIRDATPAPQ